MLDEVASAAAPLAFAVRRRAGFPSRGCPAVLVGLHLDGQRYAGAIGDVVAEPYPFADEWQGNIDGGGIRAVVPRRLPDGYGGQ